MKSNAKVLKIVSLVSLVVAIMGISVAFAAMSRTLDISGRVKVLSGDWEVTFTNVVFSANGTKATETVDTSDPSNPMPNLTGTTFTNYEIVLTQPGDKGTYTITVGNLGSIDAQLTGITWNTGTLNYVGTATDPVKKAADEALVAANLTYRLTWSDGSPITVGDDLNAGNSRKVLVTAEYSPTATELPSAPVIITGKDLTLTFESK